MIENKTISTIDMLFRLLRSLGVKRYFVKESIGCITLYVTRKNILKDIAYEIKILLPASIYLEVKKIKWYQGWFKKYECCL